MLNYLIKWDSGDYAIVRAKNKLDFFYIMDEYGDPTYQSFHKLNNSDSYYIDNKGDMNIELLELIDNLNRDDSWEVFDNSAKKAYYRSLKQQIK